MRKERGFTLIELLVVIAIIGLFSSVIIATLGTTRGKGRDAKRQQDMHSLQIALELYRFTNGAYPACSRPSNDTAGNIASMTCLNNALVAAKVLPNGVQDPQYPNRSYAYDNWCRLPSPSGAKYYRLWTTSEYPQSGSTLWWSANYIGITSCQDPS